MKLTGFREEGLREITTLLLYALSAIALISFLYVSMSRFTYPFDLIWDESMVLDNVWRVYDGLPIYQEPNKEFAPSLYAPMYYYVCAGMWKIVGPGFWSARLISILSTLFISLLIFLILRRLKVELPLSVAASGLFLFSFSKLGQYYDLARTDMLTLAFFAGAVYYNLKEGRRFVLVAGILAALSCLTKQNFIILSLTIPVYYLLSKRWWDALLFAATLSVLFGGVFLILHIKTGGWSSYLMFTISTKYLVAYPFVDLKYLFWIDCRLCFVFFLPSFILISLLIYYLMKRELNPDKSLVYFLVILAGALLQSVNNRMHYGSWINQYIPLFVLLFLALILAISKIIQPLKTEEGSETRFALKDLNKQILAKTLVILQLILLSITMSFGIPKTQDYENAKRYSKTYESLQKLGPILMTYHGFFSRYYSGKTTMHIMALTVYQYLYNGNKLTPLLPVIIEDVINSKYFAAIIIDSLPDGKYWIQDLFKNYQDSLFKNYKLAARFKDPPHCFITFEFEPKYLLIRKDLIDKAVSMQLIPKQDGSK